MHQLIDGKVIEEHLKALNLDIDWLLKELSKQNIVGSVDILLAYINTAGVLHIHMKNTHSTNTAF